MNFFHFQLHKMISLSQIRAARALLNWTQGDLAKKSGLSLRALNSIERGTALPRIDNLRLIQETFEKADIEFGDNDGVRRRTERLEIIKFEGKQYLDQHLLDIVQEVRTPGSEILFNVLSEKSSADMTPGVVDAYFEHICRYRIGERLIMGTGETYIIGPPSIHRWLKPETFNHVYYVVYGDNVAFQLLGEPHRTIIIRNPGMADMFRRQFEANWAIAEMPWFAKRYKIANPNEPWSMAKAAAAREWIANTKA